VEEKELKGLNHVFIYTGGVHLLRINTAYTAQGIRQAVTEINRETNRL
jgi:hypothetical protein